MKTAEFLMETTTTTTTKWPVRLISGGAQFMEVIYVLRAVYIRGRYLSGSVNSPSTARRTRTWTVEMPLGTLIGTAHTFEKAKLLARQQEGARS